MHMDAADLPLTRRQARRVFGESRARREAETRANQAEREVRDLVVDRDRWKRRAEMAEALVRSAGVSG